MAYLHIENLYRDTTILDNFKEVYAMEKIHGTSAHISYKSGRIAFFGGGDKYEDFVKLFDEEELKKRLDEMVGEDISVHVYGEFYGGKIMAMRETYGDKKRFVVFEVKIGDKWLNVPRAEAFAHQLDLEFVFYKRIPCTLEAFDEERDAPSVQAVRNIGKEDALREGIVVRPLEEFALNSGKRLIIKHKGEKFSERKSKRDTVMRPEKAFQLSKARDIAAEWVTRMRLTHVLDKLGVEPLRTNLGKIIPAMLEDVQREGADEIEWTKEVGKAVGHATVELIKERERARASGK